jgi:tetratricopeptide (TPR) repeat protein
LWTVPLAPTLKADGFEGYALLEELRGEAQSFLFQAYRDAFLWSFVQPAQRENLFGVNSPVPTWNDIPADLSPPVEHFRRLASDPAHVNATELAGACRALSDWAAAEGHLQTEYHFADLSARVAPEDPDLAFNAGRAARRHGRAEDARTWFRRTIALARRADDEATYASAYLGWGILEERQGDVSAAMRLFVKAWKAAKRGKLRELAAAARHNMIGIALAEGNFARGQTHIIRAYKLYGAKNPQLHRLANDAASFWFVFGFYSVSLPLFEAALPRFTRADERAFLLANISRAAAASGDRERYLEARDEILDLNREMLESFPEIFIELALGAHTLGYAARAKELANRAVEAARNRRDEASLSRAVDVAEAIARGDAPDKPQEPGPDMTLFAARFLDWLRELP